MANIKVFKRGDKTKVSKNFSASEFDCKCGACPDTPIDLDHVSKLQKLREDLNSPMTITSAFRCEAHNAKVGGSKASQHVKGTATDIVVKGMTPDEVADACEHFDGLGRYNTFTHLDNRGFRARWDFRKKKEYLPSGPNASDINITLEDIEKNLGL